MDVAAVGSKYGVETSTFYAFINWSFFLLIIVDEKTNKSSQRVP